eukprot:10045023-Lingulodinium_polyedra.AAC.1
MQREGQPGSRAPRGRQPIRGSFISSTGRSIWTTLCAQHDKAPILVPTYATPYQAPGAYSLL